MKIIATEWENFSKVLPPDAGPVQINETRRAFYAGYVSLMAVMEGEIGAHRSPEARRRAH